ncbi:hypothetical protein ACLKA6_013882 [Drosophila palustris]
MDLVWQNSLTEIKKRGQYLLHSEKWAGCRFLLPDLTDPIIITDVQPEAFEAMLEYIYTDRITIGSFDVQLPVAGMSLVLVLMTIW